MKKLDIVSTIDTENNTMVSSLTDNNNNNNIYTTANTTANKKNANNKNLNKKLKNSTNNSNNRISIGPGGWGDLFDGDSENKSENNNKNDLDTLLPFTSVLNCEHDYGCSPLKIDERELVVENSQVRLASVFENNSPGKLYIYMNNIFCVKSPNFCF